MSNENRRQFETCGYCTSTVLTDQDQPVPGPTDDEAWGDLANDHDNGCEWIITRAHRINIS